MINDLCYSLDIFRWRQERIRHGWLGSIARALRDRTVDLVLGLCGKVSAVQSTSQEKCDFLLLQSSEKVVALRRKHLLINAIKSDGYDLREIGLAGFREIIINRQLIRPPFEVPTRYYFYAAHAEWIVRRYSPKVLLNDRNGSLYSPFLRAALGQRGGLLVHLAHATTLELSRRLDMNDYDYYLLFGRSSLDALKTRPLLFGESTAILTGSHMIDQAYNIGRPELDNKTVLLLGVGPDREKVGGYLRTYELVKEWVANNKDYRLLVKRHPRSKVSFWSDAAEAISNIHVLPESCSLAQALLPASVVVNIMSNAVIEAALAKRPVVYCNCSDDRDIFSQEKFFGRVVKSVDDFESRMRDIQRDFLRSIDLSEEFSRFHLFHGFNGLDSVVNVLECIVNGSGLDSTVEQIRLTNASHLS